MTCILLSGRRKANANIGIDFTPWDIIFLEIWVVLVLIIFPPPPNLVIPPLEYSHIHIDSNMVVAKNSEDSGALSTLVASGGTTTQQRLDVTLKLPQLQNLCKRDPVAYREDYEAQVRRLVAELNVMTMMKSNKNSGSSGDSTVQRVVELIQFAAAVSSSSYKGEESDRIATLLMGLLGGVRTTSEREGVYSNAQRKTVATTTVVSTQPAVAAALHRDVRRAAVSALILMRNKGTVPPLDLLQLFFSVMAAVSDKTLRELLYRHMVNDIRNINKKGKRDERVNRSIQTFLHRILQNSSGSEHTKAASEDIAAAATEIASKRAVDMVCELYRRRVWTDDRTVAILASAVENTHPTVSSRAMRFFLGIEEKMAADEQSQKESELAEKGQHVDYHLHSRKTSRRSRQTERALKNKKRAQQKKESVADWMDETPESDKGVEASKKLYPAMELLRDPQGLAETIFRRLKSGKSIKYETKLLMINFITRLAGNHELLLMPLYNFLQKYMGGHQRDVTAVLAYTVQACHNQVPPDEIYGILKTIAHNFITERCSEEQMAVGINAVRAICARVPACMSNEEASGGVEGETTISTVTIDMEAFARDLAAYSNHRDRSVAIAGKAWLNFVREVHPALLQGKDRGLKGSALMKSGDTKPARYGELIAPAGVEGADLLVEYEAKKKAALLQNRHRDKVEASGEWEDASDEDEASGEWENVEEEEDENGEWEDVESVSEGGNGNVESSNEEAPDLVRVDDNNESAPMNVADETLVVPDVSKMSKEERDQLKQQVSATRIFSAADFAKMRKLVEREQRAKRDPREAARRKRAIAQGRDFEALSDDESVDSEAESAAEDAVNIKGTVNPQDIMATATRKRQSRAEKLEKVLAGRSAFEAKGRAGGSTNVEKKRKKNFVMSKFSMDARRKGRGKSHSQCKKRDLPKSQKGTHEARKRRRKV
jgi:protein SDA1